MNWCQFFAKSSSPVAMLITLSSIFTVVLPSDESNVWSDWWSYDGISGPDYWGLLNSDWKLCTKGRYQSPVNIQPQSLVFDPSLSPIYMEEKEVKVMISNTGHDVSIKLAKDSSIAIYGGPLAYKYRLYEIKIHFGSDNSKGSEHKVAGNSFAVEIQFMAFNEDLYSNITYAWNSPHGLAALAILAQVDTSSTVETDVLFDAIKTITYKGDQAEIKSIVISSLLPETQFYMTYDGSLPFPPCHEVVTWMVMNRPIVIRQGQLDILRTLHQGDKSTHRVLMANNYRSTVPLKNRTIRTNIKSPDMKQDECVTKRETKYEEYFTYTRPAIITVEGNQLTRDFVISVWSDGLGLVERTLIESLAIGSRDVWCFPTIVYAVYIFLCCFCTQGYEHVKVLP